jgi:hypothetical protein
MRGWQWVTGFSGLLFGTLVLGVVASLIADRWHRFSRSTRAGLVLGALLCGALALVGTAVDEEDQAGPTTSSRPGGEPSAGGCFSAYFQGIDPDRVRTVEEGASGFNVIRADQTKTTPFGLLLTERNQPLGAIRALYFSNGNLFRIESVVDAQCRDVQQYSKSRPARKRQASGSQP